MPQVELTFKKEVTTLRQLSALSFLKKSVHVPKSRAWTKPKPAAFMIHLPGIVLQQCFDLGMFVYEKKK